MLYLFIFSAIIPSLLCFRIDRCEIESPISFLDDHSQSISLDGYIEAELESRENEDVATVKNMTFVGSITNADGIVSDVKVKFITVKAIRRQRVIEYSNIKLKDYVDTQCSISFVNNYNRRMGVQRPVENQILRHAEYCIEKVLCDFKPEEHRIGDTMLVKSTARKEANQTTSQKTVNKFTDLVLDTLINGLIRANKTVLKIPEFKLSMLPIYFSSSGGPVEILEYMKRVEDFAFEYEGHEFIVSTALNLTGGLVQLNNVSVSTPINNFVDGTLPVNMNQTNLRMKVGVDYNSTPCKVSVKEAVLTVPTDHVDFSVLKIKVLGFEITNVQTILRTLGMKTLVVNGIAGQLTKLLTGFVEGLNCEDYRSLIFNLKQN